MTVYVVRANQIWGVYATREAAERACEDAQYDAEMGGSRVLYGIEEFTVEE